MVKSHGSADSFGLRFAIQRAYEEARNDVLRGISERMATIQSESGVMIPRIVGTGSYLPEKVVTNGDLARIVDTSDEWIRTRTGIRSRHIAAEGQLASDLALPAAQRALQAAGVAATDIDLHHRRDYHAGHDFPEHRVHSAIQARVSPVVRLSTCRRCAAVLSMR